MQHAHQITIPMRAMMAARRAAKAVAGRMGAYVPYDLHLYEAIVKLHPWTADDVIFDVGANDGRTVFRLMRHLPPATIFSFEPASEIFRTLEAATSELANVKRFQLAMGSRSGTQTMYLGERSVLNSLDPAWSEYRATEEITVTTIDRFDEEQGIDHIALLKIDAEGHDLEVLKGAEGALRDGRIAMIQVEAGFDAPGWREMPSVYEIQKYLREFGYHLYGIYNQCRAPLLRSNGASAGSEANRDALSFCDALFVR